MSNETTPAAGSLARKLVDVQLAVDKIPKNGYNNHHGYAYATDEDILTALRRELAERKVILFPEVTGQEVVDARLTTLSMAFTWVDAESGESQTCEWAAQGSDTQDKGVYKGITGGVKYFLLKSFLIPTGDDPENPAHDQGGAATRSSAGGAPAERAASSGGQDDQPRQPRGGQRLASEKQVKLVRYRASEAGIDDASLQMLLESVAGVESADAIPQRLVDTVLEAIKKAAE